jgi:hypothetical protein
METYPRLTKTALIERLRIHERRYGSVSTVSLKRHDPSASLSIHMHFPGLSAAREAAGVAGPPYIKPKNKTGPKPTSTFGRRPNLWTKERVLADLRRLHRAGRRTAHADLMAAGLSGLVHAAVLYAGGLRAARALAGIAPLTPRPTKKWWNEERVVVAIKKRKRAGKSLASTLAPPKLVTAGRWHFGNWSAALAAAGVDSKSTKLRGRKYTKEEIITRIRRAAASGSDLKATSLAKHMKLEAVRREFGTLRDAIVAAGFGDRLKTRTHGRQIWNRERLVNVLRERAKQKDYTMTSSLRRVAQRYFGGCDEARRVARVPSPIDIRIAQRRGYRAVDRPSSRRGASTKLRVGSRRAVLATRRAG